MNYLYILFLTVFIAVLAPQFILIAAPMILTLIIPTVIIDILEV